MAVPTSSPRGPSSHKGVVPQEWPAQAADTIVDTIAMVRDRTTKPALIAARGLVYGLIAAVIGTVAFFLLIVLITRVWANYFPGDVWILYAILGVLFSGVGLWALRKAKRPLPDVQI